MSAPSDDDVRAWARSCKACWEFEIVQEMVKGHGLQREALEMRLFAQPGPDDLVSGEPQFDRVWERLLQVAERVLLPEDGIHVDIEPFDSGEHLREETGRARETLLLVRFVPTLEEDPGGPEMARPVIARIETGLRSLGLRPHAWPV